MERVATGISGFDRLVEGGFPKGSVILITGAEGTCKTLMALQIAQNLAKKKKKVIYVSFSQTESDIKLQAEQFGWNLKGVEIIYVKLLRGYPLEKLDELLRKKPYLVIIDSMSDLVGYAARIKPISGLLTAEWPEDFRRLLVHLVVEKLKNSGATAICISEYHTGQPGLSWDGVSEFVCDGVVVLEAEVIGKQLQRNIRVVKMRSTKIDGSRYSLEITPRGLKIVK